MTIAAKNRRQSFFMRKILDIGIRVTINATLPLVNRFC
jgi:hypothetical protein